MAPSLLSWLYMGSAVLGASMLVGSLYRKLQKRKLGNRWHATRMFDQNKKSWFYFYVGSMFQFSDEEVISICHHHHRYYSWLNLEERKKFIERVKEFIDDKYFYTVGFECRREMPVMIAATAVQMTFGLREYKLEHFRKIIVYPKEYVGFAPHRILVGHVKGRAISLSWKHFLNDLEMENDISNVGLHEMAHALQKQHDIATSAQLSARLLNRFLFDDQLDKHVLKQEILKEQRLFSAASLKNKNEFWATSIEIFFEQPEILYAQYPNLYKAVAAILHQDILAIKNRNVTTA